MSGGGTGIRAVSLSSGVARAALSGPPDGPALVFSNSLGTDLTIWERVLPHLDPALRVIRYDTRGHGLTDCPQGDWGMGDLVADLAELLAALGVSRAAVCGLSIGGVIAQGLAAERPDLVSALILAHTAAKIGSPDLWDQRIAAVEAGGVAALAEITMERWFTRALRRDDPTEVRIWRNMMTRTAPEGYLGCCKALRDADLFDSTARLRLPALALAGDEDDSTPPDLVRETAALIPECRFALLRGCGHIPCVEKPAEMAALLNGFLRDAGWIG